MVMIGLLELTTQGGFSDRLLMNIHISLFKIVSQILLCDSVHILSPFSHKIFYGTNSFYFTAYKDLILDSNIYKDRVSIHVASQKALSFIRRYYDESEGKIYPYLTAILDVRDGVVVGIAWDDACVFCQFSNRCEEVSHKTNTFAPPIVALSLGAYFL